MTFDKAAYWAQKGKSRRRGRYAMAVMACKTCGATCGTFERGGHVGCPGPRTLRSEVVKTLTPAKTDNTTALQAIAKRLGLELR